MSTSFRDIRCGILLNSLCDEASETAKSKGFHEPYVALSLEMELAVKVALVHTELSEAVEELRKPLCTPEAFTEELADAVIRIFDIAGTHDMELGHAIMAKMAKNKARPPKHGKRF